MLPRCAYASESQVRLDEVNGGGTHSFPAVLSCASLRQLYTVIVPAGKAQASQTERVKPEQASGRAETEKSPFCRTSASLGQKPRLS